LINEVNPLNLIDTAPSYYLDGWLLTGT